MVSSFGIKSYTCLLCSGQSLLPAIPTLGGIDKSAMQRTPSYPASQALGPRLGRSSTTIHLSHERQVGRPVCGWTFGRPGAVLAPKLMRRLKLYPLSPTCYEG